jgi:PTH2 family peptidyl-tRNA hydrolase
MDFKYTQAIILRKDLAMSKGKLAVQAAHASIGSYIESYEDLYASYDCDDWFKEGQRKIAFKATSEEHLLSLQEKAKELGLIAYLVEDFGLTEFNGVKTKTALGVGPSSIEMMKEFTKDLDLF